MGKGGAMASSFSGNDRIGRTHGAASVSSPDLPTLVHRYQSVLDSGSEAAAPFRPPCGRTVYTIENVSGYN